MSKKFLLLAALCLPFLGTSLSTYAQEEEEVVINAPTVQPSPDAVINPETGVSRLIITFNGWKGTQGRKGSGVANIFLNEEIEAVHTLTTSSYSVPSPMTGQFSLQLGTTEKPFSMNIPNSTYRIVFPEGFFALTNNNGASYENSPAFTLTFTVGAGYVPVTFTSVEPADLSTVNVLDKVKIKFSEKLEQINPNLSIVLRTNNSGAYVTGNTGKVTMDDDGMGCTIDFNNFAEGGVYRMNFEGYFRKAAGSQTIPSTNVLELKYAVDAPTPIEAYPGDGSQLTAIQGSYLVAFTRFRGVEQNDNCNVYFTNGEKQVPVVFDQAWDPEVGLDPDADHITMPDGTQIPTGDEEGGFEERNRTYLIFHTTEPITDTGSWSLVIPQGSFTLTQMGLSIPNPAAEVAYTIVGGYITSTFPENGMVEEPEGFGIKFTPCRSLTIAEKTMQTAELLISNAAGATLKSVAVVAEADELDGTVYFAAADPAAVPVPKHGETYTLLLQIPANAITINEVALPLTKLTFQYRRPLWSVYPTDGEILDKVDEVELEYNASEDLTVSKHVAKVYLNGIEFAQTATVSGTNPYYLTLTPAATLPGEYTFDLTGVFTNAAGLPVAVEPFAYTIDGYEAPEISFSPENGAEVDYLQTITVNYVKSTYPAVALANEVALFQDGKVLDNKGVISGNNPFVITIEPAISTPGTYTVSVNGVISEKYMSNELPVLTYTVKEGTGSVAELGISDANTVVVDMLGRVVAKGEANLPAGLYIINGKKVMINK